MQKISAPPKPKSTRKNRRALVTPSKRAQMMEVEGVGETSDEDSSDHSHQPSQNRLDVIMKEYLMDQHRKCAHPCAVLPDFSLMNRHRVRTSFWHVSPHCLLTMIFSAPNLSIVYILDVQPRTLARAFFIDNGDLCEEVMVERSWTEDSSIRSTDLLAKCLTMVRWWRAVRLSIMVSRGQYALGNILTFCSRWASVSRYSQWWSSRIWRADHASCRK